MRCPCKKAQTSSCWRLRRGVLVARGADIWLCLSVFLSRSHYLVICDDGRDLHRRNTLPGHPDVRCSHRLAGSATGDPAPASAKTQSCVLSDFMIQHIMPALGYKNTNQLNRAIFEDAQDSYSNSLASDFVANIQGNNSRTSYSKPFSTAHLHVIPELGICSRVPTTRHHRTIARADA